MAWYDTNKNGGHKGAYARPEPGYGRNAYPEHVHFPVVLQAEYRNAQRYEYQAEQVVEYRRGGGGGFNLAEHNSNPRIKDGYKHQGLGNKPHLVPWKPPHERSESGNESSPKAHNYEKTKAGSPRYYDKTPHGVDNHHPYPKPQRNHHVYNNSSSSDEGNDSGSDSDVVCKDGVCYPKLSSGKPKPNNYLHEDGREKPKAKPDYGASQVVPLSTQPAKDPYYERPSTQLAKDPYYGKPSDPRYYENPNRNTHSASAYGTALPYPAQDGKQTNYEQEQPPNRPFSRNPPQIKTKPRDEGRKEIISSTEAKKRYGGVTVPTEPKYNGTIDCKEAAKRYNGIFVPGNNY